MAGLTKAQREAKKLSEADASNNEPPNQGTVLGLDTGTGTDTHVETLMKVAKSESNDIKIINVDADNDVLRKLNIMEAEETNKLKKVVINNTAPQSTKQLVGNGMVAYFDNKLQRQCSEKANILKQMMKFNPEQYRLI